MELFLIIISILFVVCIFIGAPMAVIQFRNATKEIKKLEQKRNLFES